MGVDCHLFELSLVHKVVPIFVKNKIARPEYLATSCDVPKFFQSSYPTGLFQYAIYSLFHVVSHGGTR